MTKDYDTTVARIAGNIAAGLATVPDFKRGGTFGPEGVAEWMASVQTLSVALARGIVAETKRTEPKPPAGVHFDKPPTGLVRRFSPAPETWLCLECGLPQPAHDNAEYCPPVGATVRP